MVEPELGLFKLQVEGTHAHDSKYGQPHFGYAPEVLNAIDNDRLHCSCSHRRVQQS